MKWKPQDVIAGIIVLCCFVLRSLGHDDVISWTQLAIVAAYYGLDLTPWVKIGRNQKREGGNDA